MQSLTAGPRSAYSRQQVLDLIHADDLSVATAFELLDRADRPVADVTAAFDPAASSITWTGADEVSRRIDVTCYRDFAWDSDRIRVRRDLSSALLGLSMSFYRGVFVLTLPDESADDRVWVPSGYDDDADQLDAYGNPTSATARTVIGWDKIALLKGKIGRTWQTQWTETGQRTFLGPEVQRLIDASRWSGAVTLHASAATTPITAPQTWPYDSSGGATFLRVLVDLLTGCGFEKPWADEAGALCARPLLPAGERGAEYTLDADDPVTTILGPVRQRSQNVAATPNSFRYVATGWPRTTVLGDGEVLLEANQSNGPASIAARGVVWNEDVGVDGVTTQDALLAVATARRERDLRALAVRQVQTGPLPVMGHLDLYSLVDAAWGTPRLALAKTYTEPLAQDANVLTPLTVEELS